MTALTVLWFISEVTT